LKNPSARIVVGRLGGIGTGAFDVLAPVQVVDPLKSAVEEANEIIEGVEEAAVQSADEDVQMNDVEEALADAE